MKFYFASWTVDCYGVFKKNGAERGLISYVDLIGKKEFNRPKDLFLDSGAFSAMSRGAVINIDDYAEFIKTIKPNVYANLDIIGSFEGTKKNQKILESKGLNPLPCVHYGASKAEICYWLDGYDYISIGGLVPYAKYWHKLKAWTDLVFNCVRSRMPKKIHAFGMGSYRFLSRYPCYSADSTGWQRLARYGNASTDICDDKLLFLLRGSNVPRRYEVEIIEQLRIEKEVTDLWKLRGIEWRE